MPIDVSCKRISASLSEHAISADIVVGLQVTASGSGTQWAATGLQDIMSRHRNLLARSGLR